METFANISEIYAEHSYSKGYANIKVEPYSEEYSLIDNNHDYSVLSYDAKIDDFEMDLSAQESVRLLNDCSDEIKIEENLIKDESVDSYEMDDDVDVMDDFKNDFRFNLFNCSSSINNRLSGKLSAGKSNGHTSNRSKSVHNIGCSSKTDQITKEHEERTIKDNYFKQNDFTGKLDDLNGTVQIKEQEEALSINVNGDQNIPTVSVANTSISLECKSKGSNLEEDAPDMHSEPIINDIQPTISKDKTYVLDYERQNKERKPSVHFYKCTECNMLIENQKLFFIHIQKCGNSTSNNTETGVVDETTENSSQSLYICTKCNLGFMSKQALTMHSVCQRTAVNEMIDVGTENDQTNATSGLSMENELKNFMNKTFYKCDHCTYGSRSKFHLKRHLLMHKGVRPFQCDCGYSTADLSNFKRHIRIHTQERPFKCKKCPYRAKEGQQVKKHYMAKHTDIRPFKCDSCDFQSVTRQALQNHSAKHRKKYVPEPLYKCYRCNFRSKHLQQVKAHINTHSENYNCADVTSQDDGDNSHLSTVKIFQCATCEYRTEDKEILREHIAIHSKELLRCSECSYQTFYRASYDVHVRKHTENII